MNYSSPLSACIKIANIINDFAYFEEIVNSRDRSNQHFSKY